MPELIIWKNQEIDRLKRDMDRLFARLRDDFCMPLFPRSVRETLFLDLGLACDIADVRLNGVALGVRAWAPYVLPLGQTARSGLNELEVHVTNSMANTIQGLQLPSGLLGPIELRKATSPPWNLARAAL